MLKDFCTLKGFEMYKTERKEQRANLIDEPT